jgi:hypothetical protein
MKDSLKHKDDEVSRGLMEEREKALKAFQEHFMGKTKETDPPVETRKGRKTGKRLTKGKSKVAADKGLQLFDRIRERYDLDLFSRIDLTSTEKLLILFLQRIDPERNGVQISVRNLAAALGVNKNTALDTIISLELKEIISRSSTPRGTALRLSL